MADWGNFLGIGCEQFVWFAMMASGLIAPDVARQDDVVENCERYPWRFVNLFF
jgi:hypothetical protein